MGPIFADESSPLPPASPWWIAAAVPILLTLGGGAKWAWDQVKHTRDERRRKTEAKETAYITHLEQTLERCQITQADSDRDCARKDADLADARVKIEGQKNYARYLQGLLAAAGIRYDVWDDEPSQEGKRP